MRLEFATVRKSSIILFIFGLAACCFVSCSIITSFLTYRLYQTYNYCLLSSSLVDMVGTVFLLIPS